MTESKEVELKFRNDPKSLSKISELKEICLELRKLQMRNDKSVAAIAEKHGVKISAEIYFSLIPQN